MSAGDRGGVWRRLRRLDDRSGATEYVHSRAEFFAFIHVGAAVLLAGLLLVSVYRRDWPLVAFAAIGFLLEGTRAYVGMKNRSARNRSEDKWRDPW